MLPTRLWRAFLQSLLQAPRRVARIPKTRLWRPRLSVELLEERVVPTLDTWIAAGSGDWDVGTNWSMGNYPGAGDTAVIDTTGNATITVKSGDNINIQAVTTASTDTLSITGGSFEVTSGTSALSGPLSISNATLEASGSGVDFTANSTTLLSQSNLYAQQGATISFPNLTSTVTSGTFQAQDANSVLNLASVTKVTQSGSWSVNAYSGGEVNLSGLTSLTSTNGMYFTDNGGSTFLDPNLKTLTGVNFTIDGTDANVASAWTSFTYGRLEVDYGAPVSLPNLTSVNESSLYAQNGGQLTLAGVTSYVADGTWQAQATDTASGTPSLLSLPNLSKVTQSAGWSVNSYSGATVNLSSLTSLTGTNGMYFTDNGGSTLEDPTLKTLTEVNFTIDGTDANVANAWTSFTSGELAVDYGAPVTLPHLTDVNESSLYAENGGQLTLAGVTSYVASGTWQAQGTDTASGTPSLLALPNLSKVTQSGGWSVNALSGATVNLSSLPSLTGTNGMYFTDTGSSTLEDPALTTLVGVQFTIDGTDDNVASAWTSFTSGELTVDYGSPVSLPDLTNVNASSLYAENGGQLTLAGVTSYVASGTWQAQGMDTASATPSLLAVPNLTNVTQSGGWSVNALSGATVNLSSLPSLTGTNGMYFTDTGSSTLEDPALTTLVGVQFTIDGTDVNVASAWTSFTSGELTVDYGSPVSLPDLTNVNASSLYAENGGQLTLAGVTSYVASGTWQAQGMDMASGTSSLLAVPNLTQVTRSGGWSVNALSGATVNLSSLPSLAGTNGMYFTDTGSSTLEDPALTTLVGVQFTIDGTDANAASAWTSFTSGGLEVNYGAPVSLPNLTDIDGSSFYAENGGQLTLPGVTSCVANGSWQAQGTNSATATVSLLAAPNLTQVTQSGGWSVIAVSGATMNLSSLTSLTSTNGISITDNGNSTLEDPNLATLNGVNISLDGTDSQVGNGWASIQSSVVNVSGGTLALPALNSLTNSTIYLENGAAVSVTVPGTITVSGAIDVSGSGTLTLGGSPALTSASLTESNGATVALPAAATYSGLTTLLATGSGGTIVLSNTSLAELTDGSVLLIEAQSGGSVTMPDLTSISGGPVVMLSNGSGSVISLTALQTFTSTGGATESGGGLVQSGVALPAAPDIWLSANSEYWDNSSAWLLGVPTSSMPVFINTAGQVTVTVFYDEAVSASSLTLGANDTLEIEDAATVSTTSDVVNDGTLSMDAGGSLKVGGTFTQGPNATVNEQIGSTPAQGYLGTIAVTGAATLAGTFNLSIVDEYTPSLNQNYPVIAYGSHSGNFSTYTGTNVDGEVFTPVVGPGGLALAVNPTPPSWNQSGSQYQPPTQGVGDDMSYQFVASGTAPITYTSADLPDWASLSSSGLLTGTPPAAGQYSFHVTASNGILPNATVPVTVTAQLQPPVFVDDSPPAGVGGSTFSYQFLATGTGNSPITYSATDLPAWAQINPTTGLLTGTPINDGTYSFSVIASNGISPNTTVNVSIIVAGGTSETITVPAGTTYSVPDATYGGGTTFNVGANATVTISAGLFTGGVIFNVAAGAVVYLTGGNLVQYSGTLIGAGAGTVEFASGRLGIIDGVTFDFPGAMFQWTGGILDGAYGNATNVGTMNLAGSEDKIFADYGTLDNYGTITQTGTGNLGLASDGQYYTTLKNEAGASYIIESDSGFDLWDGGITTVINAGTIIKTGGTGTSQLQIVGPLDNTGAIEADTGTLDLDANSISQLTSGILSAGEWNAEDGGSLQFPTGTNITTNAAGITLNGGGSSIAGLAGLSTNSGSLTIENGATLSTKNLTNSGTLAIDSGSTLTVNGNYTQTSPGTLNVQIAGTPASGQFGELTATGIATLGGTLNVSVSRGYQPVAGDVYSIIAFGKASGDFSLLNLVPDGRGSEVFSASLNATEFTAAVEANAADLQPLTASFPASADLGQDVTVSFTVQNNGSVATQASSWVDSVYLSQGDQIDSSAVLLGRVNHTGAVSDGDQYSGSLTAPIPSLATGNYNVLVLVDSQGLVPDANRANNLLVSSTQITVGVDSLTLGSPTTGTIGSGQDEYYQLNLPAAEPVEISVTGAAAGELELAAKFESPPDELDANYDEQAYTASSTTQTLVIPGAQAGTYYLQLQGEASAQAGSSFTIAATPLSFEVTGLSPNYGSNAGSATATITGTGFTPTTTASLTLGGVTLPASTVLFQSSTTLFATFNLTGQSGGVYALQIGQSGSTTYTDPGAFTVVAGGPVGNLQFSMQTPALIRQPFTGADVTISYENTGDTDIPSPIFDLSSDNADFQSTDGLYDVGDNIEVLAIDATGAAGILPPGYKGTLTIPFQPTTQGDGVVSNFTLGQVGASAIDWSTLASDFLPSFVPTSAENAIVANLEANVGNTTTSVQSTLDADATYLSQMGVYTSDMNRLMGFELAKADGGYLPSVMPQTTDVFAQTPGVALEIDRSFSQTILGRNEVGRFGAGWTDNWDVTASTDSFGNLDFQFGPSVVTFLFDPTDGSYFNPNSGSGTASILASGHVRLLLPGNTTYDFNPNGTLNFIQDSNSNRITCGYNGQGQLASLTDSNGSALTLAYNAQGFVSQITDPVGDITTYAYNSAGQLIQVSSNSGTTQYTYVTNSGNPALNNALVSVATDGGAPASYSYDSQGRLTGYGIGGQNEVTIAYGLVGGFTATDADNLQTQYLFDDSGDIRQVVDPLGNVTQYIYDDSDNLVKTIYPDGTVDTQSYDSDGNLIESTDSLGNQLHYTYNSTFDKLSGFTDSNGNTTNYTIDANTGNVVSTAFADGSTNQSSYDSVGDLIQSVNGDGQATEYNYNSNGQLIKESFSDGSTATFNYNSAGNLISATNSVGTFTFSYDSAGDLLQIGYPGGEYLKFSYNSLHQRTQSVDQTGSTVNYLYNSLGELIQLTDANGNNVVAYSYDPDGRLMEKLNGNGTSTDYQYDADGDLLSIINLAADGKTVNSEYEYSYDKMGQVASMTTGGQTTAYSYDADGELVLIAMPGGRTIQYRYDAEGNRVQVIDSALGTTDYTTNDMNEYTQIGDTSYQYDADGNLTSQTQNGTTTSYTYNSLNELTALSSPSGATSYQYDPLGLEYSAAAGGQSTIYQRDYSNLGIVTDQLDGSGDVLAQYTAGIGLVSETANQNTYYFDSDNVGNVVGITDASGNYVNQYQYLPFGETQAIKQGIANPFTFDGINFDITQSSGLVTMGFRQYDPTQGRFTSNDPLGLGGGDSNTRRYVGNDPVNVIDPLGLWATLHVSKGLTPHAQFFFSKKLFILGRSVDNIGFFADPNIPHNNLHFITGGTSPGAINDGQNLDNYQNSPLQQYDDDQALAKAVDQVELEYQQQGTQFQLYDGHSLAEALANLAFNSPHFHPTSPDDLTHHDQLPDQSNCQEFAYWVNYTYYKIINSPTYTPSQQVVPCDPNDIVGPTGQGADGVVLPGETLPYEIQFENEPTASAPAQNVVVTEQLDPNLDWSTFQLGSFGFGDYVIQVPAGLSSYHTVVDAASTLGVLVDVTASLDMTTGLVTWTFRSLDPTTLDTPMNPLSGFLPADNTSGIGDAFVDYTIQPKSGLTGTPVASASAAVVFDTNPPLDTMTVSNPIDAGAPADQLIARAPSQALAGGSLTMTVVAAGANGSPDILYNGSIALTVTGAPSGGKLSGTLLEPVVNGVATFHLSPSIAGDYTVVASSSSDLASVATTIPVAAAPKLSVTLAPVNAGSSSAGQQFVVTVTALLNGKADPSYAGTLLFTSSDAHAVLPASQAFAGTNGIEQFTVTLNSPGKQTVTATDASRAASTATSNTATVTPLPTTATHLAVAIDSITSPMGMEEEVSLSVTPENAADEPAALGDYLHFTSSDPLADLPANTVFVAGAGGAMTFTVILNTPGKQTITVTDVARPSLTNTAHVISGGAIDHFNVATSSIAAVTGVAKSLTITAVDPFNKTVTSYTGTVQLTSSDAAFTPMTVTFTAADKGVVTVPVSFATAGGQALMAMDTNKIFGSAVIDVVSSATHLVAVAEAGSKSSSVTAGNSVTIEVSALTAANKTDTQFSDSLEVTSSDKQAVVSPGPLVNGEQMFTITLATAGKQTISVADLSRPTLKVSPLVITVSPAAAQQLSVTGFPSATLAGIDHSFTVAAEDKYGNRITSGFNDTISVAGITYTFTKSDAGAHKFTAALTVPGTGSLTATDTTHSDILAGTESDIAVFSNVAATIAPPSFDLVGQATGVPGQSLPFTLNASQAGLPANTVFTFKINWTGAGNAVQTVSGQSGLSINHVYAATGTYTLTMTVLDAAGDVLAHATETVAVSSVAIEADPADAAESALAIGVPSTGGTVVITPSAGNVPVAVSIDGKPVQIPTPPSSIAQLLVYGQGSKDTIEEMTATIDNQTVPVAVPAVIFGGAGSNILNVSGSSANNVLVGGPGSDSLTGGAGNDILIGGGGASTLQAGSGSDILIGGSTTYDANLTALLALVAEWGGGDSFAQRAADLYGNGAAGLNGSYTLTSQTVVSDSAANQLIGGSSSALDWFWLSIPVDKLSNYRTGDVSSIE